MPIRVTCPECDTSFSVADDKRGKKVRCRKCENLFVATAKSKPAPEEDDESEAIAVKKKKKVVPVPEEDEPAEVEAEEEEEGIQEEAPVKKKAAAPAGKAPRRRDEDEDEEKPAAKAKGKGNKKKKGKKEERSKGATIAIAAVLILVIVGGLSAGVYYMFIAGDKEEKAAAADTSKKPGMPGGGSMGPGGGPPNGGPGGPDGGRGGRGGMDGGRGGNPNNPPRDTGRETPKDTGKTTTPPDKPITDPNPGTNPPKISRNSIYQYVLKSTCWIVTRQVDGIGWGTGSLVDRDNRLVLTNFHVLHGQLDFVVFFPTYNEKGELVRERADYKAKVTNADVVRGKVLARDEHRDLALIQLDRVPNEAEALPFATKEPEVGEEVHSIGNPGSSGSLWVYTHGAVRNVYHKEWKVIDEDIRLTLNARIVETDSPTNPGDSGGPCVNDRGELVGVTQGGSAIANAISFFIERSEAESFIVQTCKETLAGKTWQRSKRPSLVAAGGGSAEKLPDLILKLGNQKDDRERMAGIQGLLLLGPDAHPAIPELIRALGDSQPFVRRQAVTALRQVGVPTKDDLRDIIGVMGDATVADQKIYILMALAVLGSDDRAAPAAEKVLKLTEDPDAEVRMHAMRAVGRMLAALGEQKGRTVLEKGLTDTDKRVRSAAATTLTTDVPAMAKDVAKLQDLLKTKEPEVRAAAARALARLNEAAKPAMPDLIAALNEDNIELRRGCFLALKALKAPPTELLPALRKGVVDSDVEVRRAALELAGSGGAATKELVPDIGRALADSGVRTAALAALKALGPEAKEEAMRVADLLAVDKFVREDTLAALEAMKLSGNTLPLVVPKILVVFEDEQQNQKVFDKTVAMLAHLGKPGVASVAAGLKSQNFRVRIGSAMTLGQMGSNAATALDALQLAFNIETAAAAKEAEKNAYTRISSGR